MIRRSCKNILLTGNLTRSKMPALRVRTVETIWVWSSINNRTGNIKRIIFILTTFYYFFSVQQMKGFLYPNIAKKDHYILKWSLNSQKNHTIWKLVKFCLLNCLQLFTKSGYFNFFNVLLVLSLEICLVISSLNDIIRLS